MLKRCLLLLVLQTGFLCADVSYWKDDLVSSYVHSSELQRRWAWSFVAPHLKELKGDELILDIGCGDGKISADISKFVPQGSVIGVDLSESMIGWARRQYHSAEYPNLNFREGSFLQPGVEGPFDLIVSFCAFQHCTEKQTALNTLAQILKPGGKLLLLVPAINNALWHKARNLAQSSPKWSSYWENYAPLKFLNVDLYAQLVESTQLQVIKVKNIQTMDPIVNRKELLIWMQGTYPPVVPVDETRAFYNEWIDEYLRLKPDALNPEGVVYLQLGYIIIEAVRP